MSDSLPPPPSEPTPQATANGNSEKSEAIAAKGDKHDANERIALYTRKLAKYTRNLARSTRGLGYATFIVALFSVITAMCNKQAIDDARKATVKQDRKDSIRDIRDSIRDTRDSTRLVSEQDFDRAQLLKTDSQLIVSRDQDSAVWNQIRASGEIAATQLRAYLDILTPVPHWTGDGIQMQLTIKNAGETPATKVYLWYNSGAGVESDIPFNTVVANLYLGTIVKSTETSDTAALEARHFAVAGTADSIKRGAWDLFFWGFLQYKDAFNNIDTTPFRLKTHWNPAINDLDHFVFCKEGNG